MNNEEIIIGLMIDEHHTLSFTEVCHRYHISKELILDMIEYVCYQNIMTM